MKRKNLTVIMIFAAVAAVLIFVFSLLHVDKTVTNRFFSMDTSVRLTASEDNINTYINVIKKLDKTLSAYNSSSEISLLNNEKKLTVSDITAELLKKAVKLNKDYPQVDIASGALTRLWNVTASKPKIPEENEIKTALKTVDSENIEINGREITLKNNAQIDLGSCAKGYALDLLYDEFEKNNESFASVSFGSSTLLYGKKSDGKLFVTAVADPEDSSSQVLTFSSEEGFVSTSGGYERYFESDGKKYCHIIDLETGCPVESDLTSVTVISSESGLLTDYLSTCIFIDGTKNLDKYLNNSDYQVIALDNSKKIYCSESLKSNIEILNESYSFNM